LNHTFSKIRFFWLALIPATFPPLWAAYDAMPDPTYARGILMWGIGPLVVAVIMFVAKARLAAWGWLIAVTIFNCFILIWPQGSTAAVAFLWASFWSFVIVGPIGASMGILASIWYDKRNKPS